VSHQKLLVIHREYRIRGGEDVFLDEILIPTLSDLKLDFIVLKLPKFFASGINFSDVIEILFMALGLEFFRPSYFKIRKILREGNFDRIILNNFLPVVSLGILSFAKKKNMRTFLWVHNSRIFCANGLLFNGKVECHKCLQKGSRWSLRQNCQGQWIQSFIYALTYRSQRLTRKILKSIDVFICNSVYSAGLVEEASAHLGIKPVKSVVLRMPPTERSHEGLGESRATEVPFKFNSSVLRSLTDFLQKPFFLFMGRASFEKGADVFAGLALKFPDHGFLLCGEGPLLEKLKNQSPDNLKFGGYVESGGDKAWLYSQCQALIISSRVPETSSLVMAESHMFQTPVIYPVGGGAEETLKYLKRQGVPLSEFRAQSFVRNETNLVSEDKNHFGLSLSRILNGLD
jgi:glycosyltransferase involved in cell wall biosynthesis